MKRLSLLLTLLAATVVLWAAPRSAEQARQVASSFHMYRTPGHGMPAAQPQLRHIVQQAGGSAAAYVFTNGNQGFVIVSADDAARDVLGYGEGTFDPTNIPANMQWMLDMYAEEIASLQGEEVPSAERHSTAHIVARHTTEVAGPDALPARLAERKAPAAAVSPKLGNIAWGQGAPFNNKCPIDPDDNTARCATGCVATAAAQIMRAWQHPAQGRGSHTYMWEHERLGAQGNLTANFGTTTYDWTNMLTDYSGSYTTTQANAVATLLYHVGVACDMGYGGNSVNGSGASGLKMAKAMSTYFKYANNMYVLRPDYIGTTAFIDNMASEIQSRPVLMSGSNDEGGHAFVCDGMDNAGFFHINWGWNGLSNSYFALTALDPDRQGIGGSTSKAGYTKRLAAVTLIYPENSASEGLTGNVQVGLSDLTVNVNSTTIGSSVTLTLDGLANIGLIDWTSDVAIKICDEEYNIVGQIGALETGNSLLLGQSYNAFTKSGTIPSLSNGTYEIIACFENNGSWSRVECVNRLYCTVQGSNVTFSHTNINPALAPDTVRITELTYLDAYYRTTESGTAYWYMKAYNGTNNAMPQCHLYTLVDQRYYINGTYDLIQGSYYLSVNNEQTLSDDQTGAFSLTRVDGVNTQYNLPYYRLNGQMTGTNGDVVIIDAVVAVDAIISDGNGGFNSFTLNDQPVSTGISMHNDVISGAKMLHNGTILIRRGDTYYTLTGQPINL